LHDILVLQGDPVSFLLNQYSFIAFSILLIIAAGFIVLRNKSKWKGYLAFGMIVSALIFAWALYHPRQTLLMNDAKLVKEMIGAGTPVVIEFQSPY